MPAIAPNMRVQMERLDEIRVRLAGISDPVRLLQGIFAYAPYGVQVYKADGHCLLTNKAFRDLFGSEPPPEYNILRDEIAEKQGLLGLAMRATSENVMAAQTLGIPTRLVLGVAWGVASTLGVVAGVFLAPALLLDPTFMLDPFLKGFAAAVLGGLNSLPGAVLGALILGVAESLTGAYLTIQFKNTLAFVVIIVVLLIRPEGLLGKEFKERV